MKTITRLMAILLAGACDAGPFFDKYTPLVFSKDVYDKHMKIHRNRTTMYSSERDIVKIIPPIYNIQFNELDSSELESLYFVEYYLPIFFVEADINEKGDRVYKGLYTLKNGKAKNLLEHGTDATAFVETSKQAFLGASDGIYLYNQKDDSVERYGSVNDSVISIAKGGKDDIYILSDNHVVYQVSENGNKKEKLEDIVNAQQIVLDFGDNLYFFSEDKVPHVRSAEGVKKIEGLPPNPSYAELLKPSYDLNNGVLFVCDEVVYIIYANGTSKHSGFEIKPDMRPSAYAPDGPYRHFYAYDKEIYYFDKIDLIVYQLYYLTITKKINNMVPVGIM